MEGTARIPAFGVFSALTLCSVFPLSMYSCHSADSIDLAAFSLSQLVLLPIMLVSAGVILSVGKKRAKIPTRLPLLFRAVFLIAFLWVTAYLLTEFSLFLSSFTHLGLRFFGYIAALLILCTLAAKKGIAAVCRCAVVFFIINALLDVLCLSALSTRVQLDSVFQTVPDSRSLINSSALSLTQLAALPVFAVFDESLPQRGRTPLFAWAVISSAFGVAASVLSAGALGSYARLVRFPFYTAAQTVGIGAFRRIDVVFLCARITGVFLMISLLLCAVYRLCETEKSRRVSSALPVAFAAAVGVVTFAALEFRFVCGIVLDRRLIAAAVLLLLLPLPLAAFLSKLAKRKKAVGAAVLAACVLVCTTVMSGCDKVQLQDRMVIKGVGIDEKNGEYLVTVQYIDNYSDGDKQSNKVISVTGTSVGEAIGALKDSSGSEPFLGQNSAVILGRETAAGDLTALLDYFVRYSESRPTARLYVGENTALELLTFSQNGEVVPIDHLTSISPSGVRNDGRFTVMSLENELLSPTDTPVVSVLGIDDGEVRLASAAYLNSGANLLDKDDYLAYCLLCGIDSESVITVSGVSCEVTRCSADADASLDEGKLRFDVSCKPQLSVLENSRGISNEEIERMFSAYLTEKLGAGAKKMLVENGCDIYGFGRKLGVYDVSRFSGKQQYSDALKTADINISVPCRVVTAKALR